MKKLIISDLDGTLLDEKKNISANDRNKIRALIQEGHLFTIATSRYYRTIRRCVGELGISIPVITSNGSLIYDFTEEKTVLVNVLDQEICSRVISYVLDKRYPLIAHTVADMLITEGHPRIPSFRKGSFCPRISDFRTVSDPIYQFGLYTDDPGKTRREFATLLKGYTVQVQISGKDIVVITPENSSKGSAAEYLRQIASMKEDDLIVFGDDENDIPLFRQTKHAVAMPDACPALKELAEHVAVSGGDRVSYALETYYGL